MKKIKSTKSTNLCQFQFSLNQQNHNQCLFFNHTVLHCKFTSKFQSRFTSTLFKKLKVQFTKRNPGKKKEKVRLCPFLCSGIKTFTNAHRRKSMNPFSGKFTTHSSMNYSCIIQQFSSDYSLRENNNLLTSVQVENEKNNAYHHS